MKDKSGVLITVFNPLRYDARVQRCVRSLSIYFPTTVFSPKVQAGDFYADDLKVVNFRTSFLYWRSLPTWLLLPTFWVNFLVEVLRVNPSHVVLHDFYMVALAPVLRKFKIFCLYDAHELLIPGMGKELTTTEKIFSLIERWAVSKCDFIFAANAHRARLMKEKLGLESVPLVIENRGDQPPPLKEKSRNLNICLDRFSKLKNQKIVVYIGAITFDRYLDAIIQGIGKSKFSCSLVFIGDGPAKSFIEAISYQCEIKDFVLLDAIDSTEIPKILELCDIGIVSYSYIGFNNFYCASNKVFEYLQSGLVILSSGQPTLRDVVQVSDVGVCFDGVCGEGEVVAEKVKDAFDKVVCGYEIYSRNVELRRREGCWDLGSGLELYEQTVRALD